MSTEAAVKFLGQLANDDSMKAELDQTGETRQARIEAVVALGEKKGYVSTTVTETSATQSVEFLDIGALLRLRPFISSDGLIRMEVHPELSKGDVELKGDFTVPYKDKVRWLAASDLAAELAANGSTSPCYQHAAAAGSDRMSQGDTAAIDVDFVRVQVQFF